MMDEIQKIPKKCINQINAYLCNIRYYSEKLDNQNFNPNADNLTRTQIELSASWNSLISYLKCLQDIGIVSDAFKLYCWLLGDENHAVNI